jgi:hypothetical protein
VLLAAIARSDGSRSSVVDEPFRTKVEHGLIGAFSFDRSGDINPTPLSLYQVRNGAYRFDRVLRPPISLFRSGSRRDVIVSMHVASGAALGAAAGSRGKALVFGLASHAAGDAVPHSDIDSRRFEIGSGLALLGLLAVRLGPFHPAVVGAAAASAPDLEHVLPLPKPGGRDLFPSHRVEGWHRSGGIPAHAQLLAAGVIVGALAFRRKEK